ncbi:MAG: HAMP domain-containing protein [Deltaproteobacteria bacterium]|nr:HAMP domain-containing protein [Deltaproteobacteria bacterium]
MEKKRKEILRTQYLIDKPFQLKYSLGFVATVLVLSVAFSIATYSYIQDALFASVTTGISQSQVASSLAQEQVTLLNNNILLFFGFFTLCLIILAIYMTHRVAGPMFSLKRRMREISQGIVHLKPLQFRKTDEFQDVAEVFNQMIKSLEEKRKNELINIQNELQMILNELEGMNLPLEQLDKMKNTIEKIEEESKHEAA